MQINKKKQTAKKERQESIKLHSQLPLHIKYIALSVILAIAGFYLGGLHQSRNTRIQYISQSEILDLEKERVANHKTQNRQLFFGNPQKAVNYIEQIQRVKSNDGSIILLTDSKIYGRYVTSISKEVHRQIIDGLKNDKSNTK